MTENDACGTDAVQVITGCMAFSFFNRTTGESIRIVLKPSQGEISWGIPIPSEPIRIFYVEQKRDNKKNLEIYTKLIDMRIEA